MVTKMGISRSLKLKEIIMILLMTLLMIITIIIIGIAKYDSNCDNPSNDNSFTKITIIKIEIISILGTVPMIEHNDDKKTTT